MNFERTVGMVRLMVEATIVRRCVPVAKLLRRRLVSLRLNVDWRVGSALRGRGLVGGWKNWVGKSTTVLTLGSTNSSDEKYEGKLFHSDFSLLIIKCRKLLLI